MTESTSVEIIVNVFGRTDVGRTREHNEDSFVVADLNSNIASLQPAVRAHKSGPKGTLFMVADGMGGAAAGEIASQMATDIVLRELRDNWLPADRPSPELFARCLKRATQSANQQIHSYATSHQEYRGMGTTATIAGFLDGILYLSQVGDSRGYLIRGDSVKQITKDQSLMQKLIEAGELTEEEAAQSERRNIILQALGPEAQIKVDLTYQPIARGDILLLCSDGLSGQITKDDIKNVLTTEKDLVAACKKLIDIANENGGPDNITVILSRFEGEGLPEAIDDDDVGHKPFSVPDGGATPPMGMERLTEGPTAPMRPSADRSTIPVDQPKGVEEEPAKGPEAVSGSTGGVDTEADTLDTIDTDELKRFNPNKGNSGKVVLIGVVILIIAIAGWFGMKMMGGSATPDSAAVVDSTQPPVTDTTKAPATAAPAAGTTTPPATTP
jgi:serine/threonine protein phosphatase PrpC